MADDQVKYSDLFEANIKTELDALQKSIAAIRDTIADAKTEAEGMKKALSGMGTATRDQQQATAADAAAVESLSKQVKDLTDKLTKLEEKKKSLTGLTKDEESAVKALQQALKGEAKEQQAAAESLDSTNMSYNHMKASVAALQQALRGFATEEKKTSDEAKAMETAVENLRNAMKDLDNQTKAQANTEKETARIYKESAKSRVEDEKSSSAMIKQAIKDREDAAKAEAAGREAYDKHMSDMMLNSAKARVDASKEEAKAAQDAHNAKQRELEEAFKAYDAEQKAEAKRAQEVQNTTDAIRRNYESEKQRLKLTDEEYTAVSQLRVALQGTSQEQIAAMQNLEIQNKSYNELYQTYNAIKDVLNAMTVAERENTDAGKAMVNRSKEIRDTLNNLQQQTGNYTLNVGNYMSAMNGLQFQAQQLMREIPSAVNIQQFFLAISNNLPMFADALSRWNKELPGIKSKIEAINGEIDLQKGKLSTLVEGSDAYIAKQEDIKRLQAQQNDLQKLNVSGWRAILKAVGSWQTLLIGGLLLLRNWKSVTEVIRNLFVRMTDEQKMFKAVNDEAASSVGSMTAKFQALQKEWQNLKAENQGEWLKQHQNDWNDLGISINNANDAENLYVKNTSIIQQAIDDRARSIAAMKLATEKYEEAFRKQVEAEQGLKNRSSSLGSQIARGLAGAGMAEGTGYLTPEQQAFQQRSEEQAIQALYNKRMAEVERIKKEAQDLITTFVLPSVGGKPNKGGGGNNNKEPKDQVSDLLTLTRQLEDQIIANIENEYKRLDEEETKRHERFIEDQEAELAKLAENDPRRAVINQMIEEENRTHERKMEEIDEKRYQNLQALTQKRLADEKKAAEEEENQEKENAKGKLKAAVDGWAEYKAKLVEEGKTRKQIVEAEVAAEIARLNLMLKLNRDVNGEIMSDEQKAKVQEWINLLEKLQQTGNYGDYKPGQFMGKGGANVTNDKKSYTSATQVVADVLGIDISQEQISALNSVFDQAKEALNSWMDARKAAADQAKELADDEVSAAENALNREIELRNQGYANDVALREKELADAKDAQKKAAEEQKKVAQEQVLLDAALQTSSMITASANIIKQFPNPLAWAPMLALMWGTFAYAKTKAYQASTKSIKFKEGGVMLLEGGSHESGHDVNLGIGPDGSNLRAEGGEYFAVINKRSSRKYGSQIPAVVNALNSGMFEDRYIKTSDAVGLLPQVIRADNGTAVDLSSLEGGVDALVKQGEQNWTIEGDYRVLRYKNLTRRVKIG